MKKLALLFAVVLILSTTAIAYNSVNIVEFTDNLPDEHSTDQALEINGEASGYNLDEIALLETSGFNQQIASKSCEGSGFMTCEIDITQSFDSGTKELKLEAYAGDVSGDSDSQTVNFQASSSENDVTVIVEDDDGEALNNAEVEVDGETKDTNSRGRVRFRLEDGSYNFEASKQGYFTTSSIQYISGDETVSIGLSSSEDEKHELTVDVEDESGNSVEDADIKVDGETKDTNSRGRVRFELEEGDYDVEASKEGYSSSSSEVDLDRDKTVDLTLEQEDERNELTVEVTDTDGNGLNNAEVEVGGETKDTNSRGRVRFSLGDGSYNIQASKEGYTSRSTREYVSGDESVSIELSSMESETFDLTVEVEDDYGNSLDDVDVEVDGETKDTNSRGRVRFSLEEGDYEVEASKEGYDSESRDVEIDGSDESIDFTLEEDDEEENGLTVNVEDEDGDAVDGADVEVDGEMKDTNSRGRVRFSLEDGGYWVDVSKIGYNSEREYVRMDGRDKSIDIEISRDDNNDDDEEKFDLTVEVRDEGGDRISDADVEVDGEMKDTNSRGRVRFSLENGFYDVIAEKRGYSSEYEEVRIDGADESVTLYLDEKDDYREYDLNVAVEDQYGNRVDEAVVTADNARDRTDSDGEAYFRDLREGSYRVVASKDGYLPDSRSLELDRDRDITMVLRKSSSEVEAEYDYTPSRPEAGETVEFDASSSDGDIVEYSWEFGDGSSGNGREVEHSYESGGWYTVRLKVENSDGNTDSIARSVYVDEDEKELGELDVEVEDEDNDAVEDARVTSMALSPYNYAVRSSDLDTDSERTSSSDVGDYRLGFELDEDELETYTEYSSGYDRVSWTGTVLESSESDRLVIRYDLVADSRRGTYRKYQASQDVDLSSGEKEVTMILTFNGDVIEEYTSVIDVPDEHSFEAENTGTGTDYTGRDRRVSTASTPFFTGYTGVDGRTLFEVPEGRYLVTASKPGYETDRTTVNVDEGERREVGLEIEDLRNDEDKDDEEDDGDDYYDREEVVIQEIRVPASVCEGDSLTARIDLENRGDDDLAYTLSASGLGTETDRTYFMEEDESDTKTVTFSNVVGSGNERVSFSTGYDSEERTLQVRDCQTQDSGLSASVSPKQVSIGDSIRVSGIAEGTGSQRVDISIGGRSEASMSTDPDGRFSTYIVPNRVGTHQVEVESRGRTSSTSVQVLPTVAVNSVSVPDNVFEGEDFEVCGDVESQTSPLVLLKKNGEIIDSKNGRGEICFELNEKPGNYQYEIQGLNRGASNTASRSVEVMEQGSEVTNFPDQIASVESGSGMVRVKLYNNRKELRNYEIELEGLPRTWTAQSSKQVSLNSGERSTEYIYFTPKQDGTFEASLVVRSEGEEVYTENIDISLGGRDRPESVWRRLKSILGL